MLDDPKLDCKAVAEEPVSTGRWPGIRHQDHCSVWSGTNSKNLSMSRVSMSCMQFPADPLNDLINAHISPVLHARVSAGVRTRHACVRHVCITKPQNLCLARRFSSSPPLQFVDLIETGSSRRQNG